MSKIKYFVYKYPNKDTFSTQTHSIKTKYFSTTLGCNKTSKVIHTCVGGGFLTLNIYSLDQNQRYYILKAGIIVIFSSKSRVKH